MNLDNEVSGLTEEEVRRIAERALIARFRKSSSVVGSFWLRRYWTSGKYGGFLIEYRDGDVRYILYQEFIVGGELPPVLFGEINLPEEVFDYQALDRRLAKKGVSMSLFRPIPVIS